MTEYYVKTDGDNGLDGLSEANAWLTIVHALTVMISGDVLNIAAGTYNEGVDVSTSNITFVGAGMDLVSISSLTLNASSFTGSGFESVGNIMTPPPVSNTTLDDVKCTAACYFIDSTSMHVTNCDLTECQFVGTGSDGLFGNNIIRCGGSGVAMNIAFPVTNMVFNDTSFMGSPGDASVQISDGSTVFTDSTFENPEKAIKIAGSASATFIQNNRKVFVGTTGTNTVDVVKSTLIATVGIYEYRDFIITPDAEIEVVETSLWETTGDHNKTWKIEATGDRTVVFQLGDMLPDTSYILNVDGTKVSLAVSDGNGVITFPEYSGSFSEKVFGTQKITQYYVKRAGNNADTGLDWDHAWETPTHALSVMIPYDILNLLDNPENSDTIVNTDHITIAGYDSPYGRILHSLTINASFFTGTGFDVAHGTNINSLATDTILDDVICHNICYIRNITNINITNCTFDGLSLCDGGSGGLFDGNKYWGHYGYAIKIEGVNVANVAFNNSAVFPVVADTVVISNGSNIVFTGFSFAPGKAIAISNGASATFIQNNRKILIGTTGTNTVDDTKSTLIATDGNYDYRNFVITPDAEIEVVETSLWETTGDRNKRWKVAATGARTVTFALGDMLPDTKYDLLVDGAKVSDAISNASGVITFPEYSGTFSEKEFETKSSGKAPVVMIF